jgi:UTP--glucose-1-phosphate uridylyltransferase
MLLEKEPIWGFLFEGTRFDTGDSLGWLQANVTIASQRSDMQSVFLPWLTQFLRSFAKD